VQMAMGMMGFWITHPRQKHPLIDEVDASRKTLVGAYLLSGDSLVPGRIVELPSRALSLSAPTIDSARAV